MSWRNSREYRLWRAVVIRRDKVCAICGSRQHRQAHHKNDGSTYPASRFLLENGVCLCKECHVLFHCSYKNSFKDSCTNKDFLNFCELYSKVEIRVTKDIISRINYGNADRNSLA